MMSSRGSFVRWGGTAHARVWLFKQARIEDRMCARTPRPVQVGVNRRSLRGHFGGRNAAALTATIWWSMVRRKSTVRFRKGAPGSRGFFECNQMTPFRGMRMRGKGHTSPAGQTGRQGSGKVVWCPVWSCVTCLEGGQDAGGAAGVAAARGGDVGVPGAAEQGDGQVPESGHDLGSMAGAHL
jgi:hypothetical protein